jgi:hypothetical protein
MRKFRKGGRTSIEPSSLRFIQWTTTTFVTWSSTKTTAAVIQRRRIASVPEVPLAGEDHGEPASSAAAITSSSRTDPPGWMTAVAPASAAARRPSGKGKKASEATTEPFAGARAGPAPRPCGGLERGDGRAVEPAHLARADAHGRAVPRVDDGVRLDVLGDRPGEQEIGEFGLGRRALRDDLQVVGRRRAVVAVLHEKAAGDLPEGQPRLRRIGEAARGQQAQVLLRANMLLRGVVGAGGDDDLGEDLGDRLARCGCRASC